MRVAPPPTSPAREPMTTFGRTGSSSPPPTLANTRAIGASAASSFRSACTSTASGNASASPRVSRRTISSTSAKLPARKSGVADDSADAAGLGGTPSTFSRIVRQPAALPASTSRGASPTHHDWSRSMPSNSADRRSIPSFGLRQSQSRR